VVLPRTEETAAADVAERLRAAIAAREFQIAGADSLRATASFGVAATTSNEPSGLIARADAALYRAKESGRNRVVCAGATDQAATNARPA
jgi:diguanylate cyclase (GGDEF)-like protein